MELVDIFVLFLILIFGFVIRFPFRDFPIDEDVGFYVYLAHFRDRGARFIKDFWGVFFPFLLFYKIALYKVCKKDIKKVRLAFSLYNTFTTLSVFFLASFISGMPAGLLAAFLYAFFSSAPHIGSYSANSEKYYVLPLTLSAIFLLVGLAKENVFTLAGAGAMMGLSFAMKPVVIVNSAFSSLHLWLYGTSEDVLSFLSGFIITLFLYFLTIMMIFRNNLRVLIQQNKLRFQAVRRYVGRPLEIFGRFIDDFIPLFKETWFVWIAALPFFICAPSRTNPAFVFILFWVAATIATLIAQRVFWQYQYIPIVHILSLCSALSLVNIFVEASGSGFHFEALFLFILSILVYTFLNIWNGVVLYTRDRVRFLNDFRKMDQYLYLPEVARYVKENSEEKDRIYVWGAQSNIYILADRMSSDACVFDFVGPFGKEDEYKFGETLDGIKAHKPKFIIQIYASFDIEVLNELTGLDYQVERVFYNRYVLYRFMGFSSAKARDDVSWDEKQRWLERLTTGVRRTAIFDYYLNSGDRIRYLSEFHQALKINPYDVATLVHVGIFLRQTGRPRRTIRFFKKALSVGKYKPWIYFELALTYRAMGDEKASQYALNQGKKRLWPYNVDLWLLWGELHRFSGNFKKAEKILCLLERIQGNSENLYFNLGQTLRDMGGLDKAEEYFRKELALFPRGPYKHFMLGMTCREMGKLKEAADHFHEEIKLFPSGEGKYHELGVTYGLMGKFKEAIDYYGKEIERYPKHCLARYQMASLLKKKGDLDKSFENFFLVAEQADCPQEIKGGAHYHLGTIYDKKNKKNEAIAEFRKCLENISDHKKAREELTRLGVFQDKTLDIQRHF